MLLTIRYNILKFICYDGMYIPTAYRIASILFPKTTIISEHYNEPMYYAHDNPRVKRKSILLLIFDDNHRICKTPKIY